MGRRKYSYYACDFETTVYDGQDSTEVWSSAIAPLYSPEDTVLIHHSIQETFDWAISKRENMILYYHNLKFDGAFWLNFLLQHTNYKQAYEKTGYSMLDISFLKENDMPLESFKYSISDRGQWYTITLKTKYNKIIEMRDSLKLMPFSLADIGKAFKTKHQKLTMEYNGFRYAGCPISDEELEYIRNDVLVLKEALEFMFSQGHDKLTIGACCLSEFKELTGKEKYDMLFPDLYELELQEEYGSPTVGDYIRKSYKGAWCYLNPKYANTIVHNGLTADVNSLYPSMMESESGNRYPIGYPKFWRGDYIPDKVLDEHRYYFVRFKCRFHLKQGYLPFIQIKGSPYYKGTECLTTSDFYYKRENRYTRYLRTQDGELIDSVCEFTMTGIDYTLFSEHYNIYDLEILDGCYFASEKGIFDNYIRKYAKIKQESKGAMRTLAKLFLNNLYGKMASNTESSFKFAVLKDDGALGYIQIEEFNKKPGYIACGSAITSYARNFTIRHAQENYYTDSDHGFIYADTDSIHCNLRPDELKGIKVHDTAFNCWKLESYWDTAIFTRQKTYIEHITHEDCNKIEKPYYNIKCAGMTAKCKSLFMQSLTGDYEKQEEEYSKAEHDFLYYKDGRKKRRKLTDFKVGLEIPCKLAPKNINGGILLVETTYTMK